MEKYSREMFVLDKFDNNEFISKEWDIVASSSIFKDEYKKDEAEKEVILGYANALDCITESVLKQNHSNNIIMEFRVNSLTIPFVFLARHTVELVLKYICKLLDVIYPPKHSLIILWNMILDRIKMFDCLQDGDFDGVKTFISVLEELDCDGSHFRYSQNNKGELYNAKPKFINVRCINNYIQQVFVKLIDSIKINKNN